MTDITDLNSKPTQPQSFAVGSLVRSRGREWIVLPDSNAELLLLKPLGGRDDEITGILSSLEEVKAASFQLPKPEQMGDSSSGRLLRDALRLGFRSSAGPFRSFARLAVDPRPYQLVPLMMALKLDPVRILIADDVGIGKTIEACLIARELLDRGEASRLSVLTPPHLAEQWQKELSSKFHIDAELVLSSTVKRLERNCRQNQSIFEVYPHTVVSIDFIKSDRHRDEFLRTAPELIIVDEAHIASYDEARSSSRHQRHELIKKLSQDPGRHMIFATATPHSGHESAFRSLLAFLNPEICDLPDDLSGSENEQKRRLIARHFVQRRRPDIEYFLDEETKFPTLRTTEKSYSLSEEYRDLFNEALAYAREIVQDPALGRHRHRVRWWSALALLRALASSPAAAAATMKNRSATLSTETESEADELGRRQVMDIDDRDSIDASDLLPGSDFEADDDSRRSSAKLNRMAKKAEALFGEKDDKLLKLISPLKQLIREEFSPIIFCRFIQTAEYLAEQLRSRLPCDIEIASVTGLLPPQERELRVQELAKHSKRILVCTDCLSEGINLQEHFDSVIHYDLSWNPTRHEQREGRVDRFGQHKPEVRMISYYGVDNQIDGIVLDVLLRKHNTIKSSLKISVPVPASSESVMEAIFEGLLLRGKSNIDDQIYLDIFDEIASKKQELHESWDQAQEKEKRSRSLFAQQILSSKADEIKSELILIRQSIGSGLDLRRFVTHSLHSFGAIVTQQGEKLKVDLANASRLLKDSLYSLPNKFKLSFSFPAAADEIYLPRTHPIVESLADLVLNSALDSHNPNPVASRSGVIITDAVSRKTTLLLLRHRFHLNQPLQNGIHRSLVEDSQLLAFTGSPENPNWLAPIQAEALLDAKPVENVPDWLAKDHLTKVLDAYPSLQNHLNNFAELRAQDIFAAHLRVRDASLLKRSQKPEIKPELPPDLLGIYVYLPGSRQIAR